MRQTLSGITATTWPDAWYWWIDAVGGFLVVTQPAAVIGQTTGQPDPAQTVPIIGDLSSRHATIHASPTGHSLHCHAPTQVNGQPVETSLLVDQDLMTLRSVQLRYHRRLAWSMTALLTLESRHRLPLAVDGVLLLAETCAVGPGAAHIVTDGDEAFTISRHQGDWWIKSIAPVRIDASRPSTWGKLTPTSQVDGAFGSFRFEPIR